MNHEIRDVEQVNRRFYASNPDRHFSARLALLLAVAASTERYGEDLARGLVCGPLRLQQTSPGPVQFAPDDIERYVALESVMLHHLIGESILRLYLAHLDHRQCPWVQVALLRDGREFRRLEKAMVEEEGLVAAEHVAAIFLGSKRAPPHSGVDDDRWLLAARHHRALLIEFARHSYEGANLYTAAKHGLAVSCESGSMAIGPVDEEPTFVVDGLWLEYLERAPAKPQEPREWVRRSELVNPPRSWLLILAGLYMLKGLWAAGRVRHCGESTLQPWVDAADLDVAELLRFAAQSGPVGMSIPIGVERRDPHQDR